jgi:serine/threonine-protein kinase
MNRLVVVEILPPGQSRSATARAEFHQEARAAARLAHPNLVTILDADEVAERLYLVLEYVDGATLDEVVRDQGPLPVARACEFIRQAALGLAHAHEKGMAHGGLSPAALAVGRPGGKGPADKPTVKVLNVGLTRLALFAARTGDLNAAAAAAEYLSPEQFTAPTLADPGCDLYALGCILYFLLTGQPPRPVGSPTDGPLLHQLGDVVPAESLRNDIPPGVAALVRGLMAKDPAVRPRTAADVAGWLAPFAESGLESSHIDFSLPPAAGGPGSGGIGFLSGLYAPPESPFADLASDEAARVTICGPDTAPISGRVPERPEGGTMLGVLALATAIVIGVGVAITVVLRSVAK